MTISGSSRSRRTFLLNGSGLAAGAVLGATFSRPARADADYPNRPIRMLVPFTPGGVSDGSARAVAEYLGHQLGQSIVVENRPGASGLVSGQLLTQADPDGYTLMLGYNGLLAINPHVIAHMPYNTLADIAAVGKIGEYPSVLAASPALGVSTWQQVFELSKQRPDGLSFGTSGTGGTEHLIGVLLAQRTGANLVHIPYKGAGQALLDTVAGHIPLSLTSVAGGAPHIKSGKVIGIGVSSLGRSATLPNVPSFAQSGVANFEVNSWVGLVAPGKTPPAIIRRLNASLNTVLAKPDLQSKLAELGIAATPGTPDQFAQLIGHDLGEFGPIVQAAGIKPE